MHIPNDCEHSCFPLLALPNTTILEYISTKAELQLAAAEKLFGFTKFVIDSASTIPKDDGIDILLVCAIDNDGNMKEILLIHISIIKSLPDYFADFLSNDKLTFIGSNLDDMRARLSFYKKNSTFLPNAIEVEQLAKERKCLDVESPADALISMYGVHIDKDLQKEKDWSESLSSKRDAQCYAAMRIYAVFIIYANLKELPLPSQLPVLVEADIGQQVAVYSASFEKILGYAKYNSNESDGNVSLTFEQQEDIFIPAALLPSNEASIASMIEIDDDGDFLPLRFLCSSTFVRALRPDHHATLISTLQTVLPPQSQVESPPPSISPLHPSTFFPGEKCCVKLEGENEKSVTEFYDICISESHRYEFLVEEICVTTIGVKPANSEKKAFSFDPTHEGYECSRELSNAERKKRKYACGDFIFVLRATHAGSASTYQRGIINSIKKNKRSKKVDAEVAEINFSFDQADPPVLVYINLQTDRVKWRHATEIDNPNLFGPNITDESDLWRLICLKVDILHVFLRFQDVSIYLSKYRSMHFKWVVITLFSHSSHSSHALLSLFSHSSHSSQILHLSFFRYSQRQLAKIIACIPHFFVH